MVEIAMAEVVAHQKLIGGVSNSPCRIYFLLLKKSLAFSRDTKKCSK